MLHLMEEIAQARQTFTAERDACAAQLDTLAEEQADLEQEQAQSAHRPTDDLSALQVCLTCCRPS